MSTEYEGMGLTPEELAALQAPDDEDKTATQEQLEAKAAAEGATTTAEKENDADDKKPDAVSADAGAPAADDAAPATTAAGAEPAAAASAPAPAEPAAAPSPAPQQAPILVAQAPEDAEAKLKEIKDSKAALRQKYDDGEITFAEFQEQNEAFDEQRLEIRLAVETAQTAQKMELQRQQNQWTADCDAFMAQYKDIYAGEANTAVFADLDAAIKTIAVMPSSANLTGPQLLDRAHRAVMAARGTPVVAETKAEPKPAPRKEIPKPTLPPDLGAMPAATGNDPGEGKWASLDRLQDSNPEAYEAALAKLPEAERDAYLAA